MARVWPLRSQNELRRLSSRAEAVLYVAFREQLPGDVLVLHEFRWIDCPRGWAPTDAESDFVVFDPHRGILVVEVKGGEVKYDPDIGWRGRNVDGWHRVTDPFEQGKKGKYAVLSELGQNPQWPKAKIVLGHAAFFPDVSGKEQFARRPDAALAIIGDSTDITAVESWVAKAFAYWKGDTTSLRPLETEGLALAESTLCRRINVRPLLSHSMLAEEEKRVELTEQQSRILEVLPWKNRAVVPGGAGTGKTVIAAELARRCVAAGLRTALLCYNSPLATVLQRTLVTSNKLLVLDYHQFCYWAIREAKRESGVDLLAEAEIEYPGEDFFTVQLPFALLAGSERVSHRFDAIIVDEGQDFNRDYWLSIRLYLQDESRSHLFIFCDDNQAIYASTIDYPADYYFSPLRRNCRNTDAIHEISYRFYRGDEQTTPPDIPGAPIQVLVRPTISVQARTIAAVIRQLITVEKVNPSDIAVLTPSLAKRSYHEALQNVASFPTGGAECYDLDRVRVDTVKRFKGLEAAVVFVWDPYELEIEAGAELVYVGLSRAKSRLIVVGDHRVNAFVGPKGVSPRVDSLLD